MSLPALVTIGPTGASGLTFAQILAAVTAEYQGIFGADAYLGNDSQDGQLLAIFSQGLSDCVAAVISAYNARSPATAQGAGLSSSVKINGLARLVPSYSTALATLVGVANTTITNGQLLDANGNVWNLPASVTIPAAGTITVTATCATAGAIQAAANTLSIQTPVYGWQSVTNAAATPGSPVETDAVLRLRQSNSVALPSQTVFDGIVAQLAAVSGVTRVQGYENDTNAADANGVPAHNLAFVVEGGAQADIVNALGLKVPPGIPTFGATSAQYTSANGTIKTVNYAVPTETAITVALTLKSSTGWSTAIESVIAQAIVDYILALPIGKNVSYTELFIPAYSALSQYPGTYTITSMTVNAGTADVAIAYNAAPTATLAGVTFTVS